MDLEKVKKAIINDSDLSISNAEATFKEVRKFMVEDLESIGALIEEAKTDLNTESIKDMSRIIIESMKLLYHLDLSVCDLFTLDGVITQDKVFRLYSAFEELMYYDKIYQESLEDRYEEME